MATGYIVWDSKNRKFLAGAFLTNADAVAFKNRLSRSNDSRSTGNSSKDQSANFTVETVTIV